MNRVIHSDLLRYLRDYQTVIRNGFMPKYHAVLCDPPYYLGSIVKRFGSDNAAPAAHGADGRWARLSTGFMGQTWDGFESPQHYQAWVTAWASPLLDYVYPGAVLMAFGGTRTYHRLVSGLEDAGWEIYDSIMVWTYGSGFPKSYDVGKNTSEQWDGYGTALKPSYEPIVLARAPRNGYTYADCATQFGSGALNIDGCRIATGDDLNGGGYSKNYKGSSFLTHGGKLEYEQPEGRFPANTMLVHHPACTDTCHPECHVRVMGEQSGVSSETRTEIKTYSGAATGSAIYGSYNDRETSPSHPGTGTAARFFFQSQAKHICWLCGDDTLWQSANTANKSSNLNVKDNGSVAVVAQDMQPLENVDSNLNNSGNVDIAENSLRNMQATGTPTVAKNAPPSQSVNHVQNVKFAGNLCEHCGIAIAQSLVLTLQGNDPAASLGQLFIDAHKKQILIQSLALFAENKGSIDTTMTIPNLTMWFGYVQNAIGNGIAANDSKSALPRFRYNAKAATWERDAGLADMPKEQSRTTYDKSVRDSHGNDKGHSRHNPHPTVKPIQLITELAKLILPPIADSRLLVPFSGSGSEMIGAYLAGWKHITGIEMTAEYIPIARARLAWWQRFDSYAMAESHYKHHDDKQLTMFEYMAVS